MGILFTTYFLFSLLFMFYRTFLFFHCVIVFFRQTDFCSYCISYTAYRYFPELFFSMIYSPSVLYVFLLCIICCILNTRYIKFDPKTIFFPRVALNFILISLKITLVIDCLFLHQVSVHIFLFLIYHKYFLLVSIIFKYLFHSCPVVY